MVTKTVYQRTMRRATGVSLGVAIAILGTGLMPSLAQDSSVDDFPEVEPEIDEGIDPEDPNADIPPPEDPEFTSSTRFFCQFTNGDYTVMYNPKSRPNEAFAWAVPAELGGGWTPELRCQEIARRLEEYRPDGLLELQTGSENGYNTVCATSETDPQCRIVFTVPPGLDPDSTRNAVFENLTIANSGEATQGVNTFVGQNSNDPLSEIVKEGHSLLGKGNQPLKQTQKQTQFRSGTNLRPHLDPADGGTGQALKKGVPITKQQNRTKDGSKGLKLQPDQFR